MKAAVLRRFALLGAFAGAGCSAVLGVFAGAGCSAVLGIESDRYVASRDATAGDAASDAGRDAGPWDCLSAPDQELDPSLDVDVTLLVMDALQPSTAAGAIDGGSDLDTVKGAWLSGMSVRECTLRDPMCASGSPPVVTGEAGAAEFHLTGDFAGFFDIRRSDLVPTTLYPGHLLAGAKTASYPAYDIRPTDFQSLVTYAAPKVTADFAPDGGLGHLIVTVYDCQDHQAPGVSVSFGDLGKNAVPFYFENGLPSTAQKTTDSYGLAGAINVDVGTVTATATPPSKADAAAPTDLSITFDVRPGAVTFALLRARSH